MEAGLYYYVVTVNDDGTLSFYTGTVEATLPRTQGDVRAICDHCVAQANARFGPLRGQAIVSTLSLVNVLKGYPQ